MRQGRLYTEKNKEERSLKAQYSSISLQSEKAGQVWSSPVSCEGQTPCNRRKGMYTAVCSDTRNQGKDSHGGNLFSQFVF